MFINKICKTQIFLFYQILSVFASVVRVKPCTIYRLGIMWPRGKSLCPLVCRFSKNFFIKFQNSVSDLELWQSVSCHLCFFLPNSCCSPCPLTYLSHVVFDVWHNVSCRYLIWPLTCSCRSLILPLANLRPFEPLAFAPPILAYLTFDPWHISAAFDLWQSIVSAIVALWPAMVSCCLWPAAISSFRWHLTFHRFMTVFSLWHFLNFRHNYFFPLNCKWLGNKFR